MDNIEIIECVTVMLKLNLSEAEFNKSEKLRAKIDDFVRFVNDRLVDKFKEEVNFDANFLDDGTMIFTIDSCNNAVRQETRKTIEKLLQKKVYTALNNRVVNEEENLK